MSDLNAPRPPRQSRKGTTSTGARKAASKSGRSRAREFALQALYQHIVSGNDASDIDLFTRDLSGFNKADVAHYDAVLQNVNQLTAADSALSGALGEVRTFAQRLNSNKGGLMAAVTGNEADAQRVAQLIDHANQLVQNLDGVVRKADQQVLGKQGLVTDAQGAVRQLNALLQDARQTVAQVDAVLKEVQGVAGNAREATTHLGDLRADVDASLRKIDALITELNRKWPFAPKNKEVTLP